MAKKNEGSLLDSCFVQREIGVKAFHALGTKSEMIAAKLNLLDEEIAHLLEKREQLKDEWGNAHKAFEEDLKKINTVIEKNKKKILGLESGTQATSGLSSDDAVYLIDRLGSASEETLRLGAGDRKRITSIMAQLENTFLENRGLGNIPIPVPSIPGDCSGCKGGCKDSCYGGCSDGCLNSCGGACMGGCKDGCFNSCGGGCMGGCQNQCMGCTGTCMGGCTGGCLGPIKAGR